MNVQRQEELAWWMEWDEKNTSPHSVQHNQENTLFACKVCDWVGTEYAGMEKHLDEFFEDLSDQKFWERDCAFEERFGYSPRLRFLETHNPGDPCDDH